MTLEDFCALEYETRFQSEFDRLINNTINLANRRNREITTKKRTEFQIAARKYAIERTLLEALKEFPGTEPAAIWEIIYVRHIFNKSGESDLDKIRNIIAADQSWKKSSGHALESVIKELLNPLLSEHGLEICLQRDLSQLLKRSKITNEERDLNFLRDKVDTDIFDLYLTIKEREGYYKVFGCVQSKTSVRDRVTRDREPSIIAMEHFFLSIAFILNGAFLRLPKFINMVNGDTHEFPKNGWHAAYVFSNDETFEGDRIFIVDVHMNKIVQHLVEAANYWKTNRQWFNNTWRPGTN